MFKNFLVLSLRNFWKHKLFSLINLSGLAIGISASLIIYLIVHYDFGFDKFHKDGDRIYRVVTHMHFPEQVFKNSGSPVPLMDAIQKEVTGIEATAPVFEFNGDVKISFETEVQNPSVYKNQPDIIFTDNNYLKLFPRQWINGSPAVLTQPFRVVLSEERARTYFPFTDISRAIGHVIYYNDSIKVTVAGIVKDLNELTDLNFKEFISLSTIENTGLKNNFSWDQWGSVNSSSQFFVKLSQGTRAGHIEKQMAALRIKYAKNAYLQTDHFLQPLGDIHFNADYSNFSERQAHRPTLYGLLVVAAFLLLLGCINFINLTTAQATQRAKEIGIRKTMGGTKSQLIFQFLNETFLLTLLATVVSIVLTPALLTIFSDYIPPGLSFDLLQQPHILIFVIALIILVSILSGFYPALILTRYQPVTVLKSQLHAGTGKTTKAWLRKTLTVTQFIIAQAFIIATIIVGKQIHYTLNKDLGFKKEAIINIQPPWNNPNPNKRLVLLNEIRSIPEIQEVVFGGAPPATSGISVQTMKFNDGKKETELSSEIKYADSGYFNLYNMKLLAGRFPLPADSIREYVINETFAKFVGFQNPADAIGKRIEREGNGIPIVGVLADFHAASLHTPVKPLAYAAVNSNYNYYHIALKPLRDGGEWKDAIADLEKAWKEVYPDDNFNYAFFDDSIANFYKSEQNISRLLKWATGLAIFISCLGLLGLVIYTTNQRTKEIGVRKVLGASVTQIVSLLSKDFVQLVLFAFVIASPLAWWAMHQWLQNFAYRTNISWWVFLLSGALMIFIALLTLSIQTIRSANANPVNSLRTE